MNEELVIILFVNQRDTGIDIPMLNNQSIFYKILTYLYASCIDLCAEQPCLNNGTCTVEFGAYAYTNCNCALTGYRGESCEIKNECQCENGELDESALCMKEGSQLCMSCDDGFELVLEQDGAIEVRRCAQVNVLSPSEQLTCADDEYEMEFPAFPIDYAYVSADTRVPNPIPDMECIRMEDYPWTSHLCWDPTMKNPGFKWSTEGPIDDMDCELWYRVFQVTKF